MYQRVKSVNFTPARSGLTTVAYTIDNGETWTTAGVTEPVAGTGVYEALITFDNGYRGGLLWRTSNVDPRFAREDINPETEEIPAQVWASTSRTLSSFGFSVALSTAGLDQVVIEPAVAGGQQINFPQAMRILGSALAGNISGEGGTSLEFAAMGNPTVTRIIAAISPQGRQPTLTP